MKRTTYAFTTACFLAIMLAAPAQALHGCAFDKPPCTTLFPTDPCEHASPDTLLH